MRVTYRLSTSECMSSHSSKWREKQSFNLNHTSCVRMLLTKHESNLLPAWTQGNAEVNSHSSKWREEQSIILNHTSCVRMITKYESKLHSEYKWMHEFTHQQGERRAIIDSLTHILCWNDNQIWKQLTRWVQVNAWVHTAASGEKSNHSFVIIHLVLEC